MNRLDRIQTISEKHGVSLAEYVVLDLICNLGMSAEQAASYAAKILEGSSEAARSCEAAVASCVAKSWLRERDYVLVLTDAGSTLKQRISLQVRQSRDVPE
jgi:hypothetical protein